MFWNLMAKFILHKLLCRPDASKSYALTNPKDSWYPTLKKINDSYEEIKRFPHEKTEILSFDDCRLTAMCYRAQNAKGTVMFLHGFGSHAGRESAFPGLFYLSAGYNFVVPYMRAHSPSEGKYVTFGAAEKRDALLWLQKIEQTFPSLPIVIHGLSMGGGIALQLCSEQNRLLKGIVADAPCLGINHMFEDVSRSVCSNPEYARKFSLALQRQFEKKFKTDADCTEAERYVKNACCPLMFVAGSEENRQDDFARLEEVCPQPARTLILPQCEHANGMYLQTELYQSQLTGFLQDVAE